MPDTCSRDLGKLDGPVLVFGGPYGNLEATTALLEQAEARGIAPANIICTGDVVAYCGDPQGCVDAIRAAGIHVVMGNCEESLGLDLQDCGCGFDEGSDCDILSVQWFAHASRALDEGVKQWMAALPRRLTFTLNQRRIGVIHGSLDEIGRFIFHSSPADDKRRQCDALGVDAIIGGHCGLPFSENVDGRIWHNPGVIGMPANDATARTWFSLLTPTAEGIDFALHPLDYDHQGAIKAMHQQGLPEAYAKTLQSGLWPNMDILPALERTQQGQPLTGSHYFWPKD